MWVLALSDVPPCIAIFESIKIFFFSTNWATKMRQLDGLKKNIEKNVESKCNDESGCSGSHRGGGSSGIQTHIFL